MTELQNSRHGSLLVMRMCVNLWSELWKPALLRTSFRVAIVLWVSITTKLVREIYHTSQEESGEMI
jgi:hypothetical protein